MHSQRSSSTAFHHLFVNVRPGEDVEDLLALSANAFALLRVLLLHLADRLLLPRNQRCHVDLRDAWDCAIESSIWLLRSLAKANDVEGQDVCKRNDVVVPGLSGERSGGIRGRGRSVDRDRVCSVASSEQGAFKDVVVGRACDSDPGQCQCCNLRLYSLSKGSVP